jgi:NAD(P)-dependent dehydrogenase (short-subunit alcohol dehydrogenase family)
MAPLDHLALSRGSTVLVTGVNGYIGSHIADQFLQRGVNVRGTVLDVAKNAWMLEFFEARYGLERSDMAHVGDITTQGAFDAAVKDALSCGYLIQQGVIVVPLLVGNPGHSVDLFAFDIAILSESELPIKGLNCLYRFRNSNRRLCFSPPRVYNTAPSQNCPR